MTSNQYQFYHMPFYKHTTDPREASPIMIHMIIILISFLRVLECRICNFYEFVRIVVMQLLKYFVIIDFLMHMKYLSCIPPFPPPPPKDDDFLKTG